MCPIPGQESSQRVIHQRGIGRPGVKSPSRFQQGGVNGSAQTYASQAISMSFGAVTSTAGLSANVRRIFKMTSAVSDLALTRPREHREAICDVLARYGASSPRLFGSIAQGNARPDSDVDLLLDLAPTG